MVLAKSFYRFTGTIIGAVMAIAITAVFGQVPELFLLSIAVWIGFCTFGGALNRKFRGYGFVHSRYTTALIGIPALAHPDGVFLAATTKVSDLAAQVNTEFINVSHQWLERLRWQGDADADAAVETCLYDVPALLALEVTKPVRTAAEAAHAEVPLQAFVAVLPGRLARARGWCTCLTRRCWNLDTAAELLERFMAEMLAYTQTYASLALETDTRELTAAHYVFKTNAAADGCPCETFVRSSRWGAFA
ncbi:FUSC family protein [Paraburkholderia strydomiana]|uniref:FUSC family protein n=1 Tax=Paraburkholderia strydomiana TaxID=1245417 RepID=UPI00285FB29E|nr:FUSC family protein [Paraburkholderia strydomiana]MDR7008867.1 hypothetical protein [Paraburkholderia strydomiana]